MAHETKVSPKGGTAAQEPKSYHKELTPADLRQLIIEIRHNDGIITPAAIESRWGISRTSAARLIMIHPPTNQL